MVTRKRNSRSYFNNMHLTKLKYKRSQITIFIIIAVLLVVAIGIVFVVRNSLKPGDVNPPTGADNIGDFVTNCLQTTSENGLVLIGRQGGYYNAPTAPLSISYTGNDSEPGKYFTNLSNINIPYYWDGSSNKMPAFTTIEGELSTYIKDNIITCLNDFSVFKQKEFEVQTSGEMNVSVRILDNKAVVILDYPVTIKKGDFTQKKTVYSVDIPTRLKPFYERTRVVMDSLANTPPCEPVYSISGRPTLRVDCFIDVGFYDYSSASSAINIPSKKTVIFIFTDNTYKLNNIYNDWIFAYKYP